jgi:hypothetical protein
MINDIQGVELLKGFRGYPVVDIDCLARIIVKFSKLIVENPNILEMDLNPLIWTQGASEPIIVDCRMTVEN